MDRRLLTVPRAAVLRIAFALVLAVVAFGKREDTTAAPLPPDPVAEFRQALTQEKETVVDKEALRFRRENLTRKAQALQSLGDMSRALLLQEWKVEGSAEAIADIDREVRDTIADRFIKGLQEVMAKGDAARREAAAELVTETATSSRTLAFKGGFIRQRLAGLAPDLAALTNDPNPRVQQFAAYALGNVQGDPKLTVNTLERLMRTSPRPVRRAAADALGNVVQVSSRQERRVRSDLAPAATGKDMLGTATLVVPAATVGLEPDQSVETRRLSADALQQITGALVDLAPEPYKAEEFPPPGRTWTPAEAQHVEDERKNTADAREELRPLLDAFARVTPALTAAAADPDPAVRVQVRRVLEELGMTRYRLDRREASVPRGEGVPPPRPEPRPGEGKGPAPGSGGAFLPPALPASGAPVILTAQERERPAPARAGGDPLAGLMRAALPAAVAGLSDPNVRARIEAVEVLEAMGADAAPATAALVKATEDPDRFVRWAAVRVLGRLAPRNPELVVPAAARLLRDDDLDVDVAAANALERFGPAAREAVPALAWRARDGDGDIRIAAMRALEAIGTDAAPALPSIALNLVPKSREELDRQPGPRTDPLPPARVRVAAADTLGRFGGLAEQAVPVLQRSLSDYDADVRRAASEAILKVTRRQP